MSHSGITQFIVPGAVTRRFRALGLAHRRSSIAASVRGPLLTLAAVVLCDTLARSGATVPAPFPILIVTVAYAALSGGTGPAMVSAVITTLYALHFFSGRAAQLHYDSFGAVSLISVAVASLIVALLVSRGRTRPEALPATVMTVEEADAIRRRLSLLEQTSALLASSLDYESTLARVARLLVPARADWCTIHLADGQGNFRFVAGAHREPRHDLMVRALSGHGDRGLPFGAPADGVDVLPMDDAALRRRAGNDEHLRLLLALAPVRVLRVPIRARGETAGVLTLVIAESFRDIGADDVELAEELAGRASLAIENAMLHREASEADRRAQLVFGANPQPMWIFDAETLEFIAVNDATVRLYGYSHEELVTMTIMDLLPSQDPLLRFATVERTDHRPDVALARHQRKDGTIVEMELVSQELDFEGRRSRLVVAVDVSERTKALASLHQTEEHLREAQRMETVGRIGLGVAHDFNSVLTTIRGFAELLARDLADGDPRRSSTDRILQAADRGALLTRQLLAFGEPQPFRPHPVSVNAVVGGMEGLIRRLAGDDVEVETRLAEDLGTIHIDPARLEQALVSLILAARDAMPAGGTMTIETSERFMNGFPTGRHLLPGQYAVLAIGDTGSGFDTEPRRPVDRRAGEGLGLRAVNGIVRQGGGMVRVTTEPGEGRTVRIYLPLLDPTQLAARLTVEAPPRGVETVLVVEDEDDIRDLLARTLADAGYEVLKSRHGRDAILVADRHDGPIHLLVTDVIMPEMGGGEVAKALSTRRPALEVLYVSGYADGHLFDRGVSQADDSFLAKPFTGDALLRKVRSLLDRGSAWLPGSTNPGA